MDSIRHYRRRAGISQVELARRLGCSQGRISYLETGRTSVTVADLSKIATALGCTQSELIGWVDSVAGSSSSPVLGALDASSAQ